MGNPYNFSYIPISPSTFLSSVKSMNKVSVVGRKYRNNFRVEEYVHGESIKLIVAYFVSDNKFIPTRLSFESVVAHSPTFTHFYGRTFDKFSS